MDVADLYYFATNQVDLIRQLYQASAAANDFSRSLEVERCKRRLTVGLGWLTLPAGAWGRLARKQACQMADKQLWTNSCLLPCRQL